MLADVGCHNIALLRAGVGKDVLDQVVSVLVAGDVNQGDPGTVDPALTHAVEVPGQEIDATDLETLFHNLGGVLIHTVLGCESNDMINRTASILWSTMLAYVLDAPVTKLAMGDNVDAGKHLFDAGSLWSCQSMASSKTM